MQNKKSSINKLELISQKITDAVGTPLSIVVHTLFFVAAFLLILLGLSPNTVMLGLTTAVSLEAIYLALFIQMTVNRQAKSLSEVEKDIDEIQEDVESLEEISEDITELQLAEKQEELGTDQDFAKTDAALKSIEEAIIQLRSEITTLKSSSTVSTSE